MTTHNTKADLILEDGSIFSGISFGSQTPKSGEVVFNTGMVGYPESLTDPSYKGQILVLTYPLIGNYGIPSQTKDKHNIMEHFESEKIHIQGLIINDYSEKHSHWNAEKSLSDWLIEHNIPAISGIDTRALTKKLREKGTMLGKIKIKDKETEFYNPDKINLVEKVSCKEIIRYGNSKTKIVLIDCGVKHNIIRCFLKRDIQIIRVPWDFDPQDLKEDFDAVFISNGPGDPAQCKSTIKNLKNLIKSDKNIPIFGICLGNQLLALASGTKTYKLKYGHRSQNQPCTDLKTNRSYITSQNHGFAINEKYLGKEWEVWFKNINDGTVEGIRHKKRPIISVQFHPEANCGPTDTEYIFDDFIKMIEDAGK